MDGQWNSEIKEMRSLGIAEKSQGAVLVMTSDGNFMSFTLRLTNEKSRTT